MYKYYILFIAHFCQSTFSKALLPKVPQKAVCTFAKSAAKGRIVGKTYAHDLGQGGGSRAEAVL